MTYKPTLAKDKTLRDEMAIAVVQALINNADQLKITDMSKLGEAAYVVADSLMAARKRR